MSADVVRIVVPATVEELWRTASTLRYQENAILHRRNVNRGWSSGPGDAKETEGKWQEDK